MADTTTQRDSATLTDVLMFEAGISEGKAVERNRIVAWLRRLVEAGIQATPADIAMFVEQNEHWRWPAPGDAIERGEHDLAPHSSPPRGG